MKKFFSILFVLIVIPTTLCACGKNSNQEDNEEIVQEEIDISIYREVETTSENLDLYREEVFKRLNSLKEDDQFITDKEWEVIAGEWERSDILDTFSVGFTELDTLYNEATEYYYPLVFREGNSLVLWYTDKSGSVLLKKVYGHWNESNYVGKLHSDSEDEWIYSKVDCTLTYSEETGEVKVWQFGEVEETYTDIPSDSVYCGFSRFEGYIFRSGTDVYSLNAVDTWNADGSVECIAHDVEYVIDADYYYGSDPWCQPLFLMTDGSLKAYVGWEGNQAIPDDPSHLCDLRYEGGYR